MLHICTYWSTTCTSVCIHCLLLITYYILQRHIISYNRVTNDYNAWICVRQCRGEQRTVNILSTFNMAPCFQHCMSVITDMYTHTHMLHVTKWKFWMRESSEHFFVYRTEFSVHVWTNGWNNLTAKRIEMEYSDILIVTYIEISICYSSLWIYRNKFNVHLEIIVTKMQACLV